MTPLEVLLEEFVEILQRYNPANYSRLYPPLSEDVIDSKLQSLKINSNDFKTFFKWRNGFDPKNETGSDCQIFQFGTMLSLDAIERKVNINNTRQFIWSDTFIPIISDSTGQYILYNNKQGKNFGQLYLYSASIIVAVNLISCYDSISALIDTTLIAYQNKILQYNPDEDWLSNDVDRYFALAKEKNPKSKFWTK